MLRTRLAAAPLTTLPAAPLTTLPATPLTTLPATLLAALLATLLTGCAGAADPSAGASAGAPASEAAAATSEPAPDEVEPLESEELPTAPADGSGDGLGESPPAEATTKPEDDPASDDADGQCISVGEMETITGELLDVYGYEDETLRTLTCTYQFGERNSGLTVVVALTAADAPGVEPWQEGGPVPELELPDTYNPTPVDVGPDRVHFASKYDDSVCLALARAVQDAHLSVQVLYLDGSTLTGNACEIADAVTLRALELPPV